MTQPVADARQDRNGDGPRGSLADDLKRESERLRLLAEELSAREEAEAEMRANYPRFKRLVHSWLREQFESDLGPLPEKEWDAMIAEEGGVPFDTVLRELEAEAHRNA